MTTWIKDSRGNKCSVEYFGSKEAAQKALDSLINCKNCTNCSDCSDCSGCSDCSDCSGCSDCSDCSGCFDCSDCSGCSRCSDCSDCSGCSRCSDCSRCSRCSGCSGCSGCSDCSGCSRCSRCSDCYRCSDCSGCSECFGCSSCSRCSDCSRCSGCSRCSDCFGCSGLHWKDDKKGEKGDSDVPKDPPSIPVIADLHKKVYEAITAPDHGFDMSTWHTCETTHCRGGWVVHLAGDAGKALENYYNTELAAMLIYDASCPGYKINPCRFHDSNEDSLADMKRLSEEAA